MEKGELPTYRHLYQNGKLNFASFLGIGSFSLLKYTKRVLTIALRRPEPQAR